MGDLSRSPHASIAGQVAPLDADLLRPYPLEHFGLAFNQEVQVLICTLCRIGLPPGEWKSHLGAHHQDAFRRVQKELPEGVEQASTHISSLTLIDPLQAREHPAGSAPVKGIEVRSGYYCPVEVNGSPCHKVMGASSTFSTHLSSCHKDATWKPSSMDREKYTCDFQTIFNGKHRRYFRVLTGLSPSHQAPDAMLYKAFLQQLKTPASHIVQADDLECRELSSLLKVTRWDSFVKPFRKQPADVSSLIAFPSYGASHTGEEKHLCLLHEISMAWLRKVRLIWESSTPSIRRLIGTA
jgi:hypothetical protein